jgi:L-ribulose-5-phosphate 3-epimerase
MNIGIMQGRLVPRYLDRYQAFPVGYWQAEFHIAKSLGFSSIEFILDHGTEQQNPLMNAAGLTQIQTLISETGVAVRSICADYFMEAPLHSPHKESSQAVLKTLIANARQIGVKDIVIPCVDQSSLKSEANITQFIQALQPLLPDAEAAGIFINLETDLAPIPFKALIAALNSPVIRVNYDTGNSASLGYNPTEEFSAYGHLISDLHIKDRVLGGGSVSIGTGDVDFVQIVRLLKEIGHTGTVILQASRQLDYIEDIAAVRSQLERVRAYFN